MPAILDMRLPVVLTKEAEREFDHRDVRCARVRRFPYCVFYRLQNSRIEVVAILSAHRDPSIWKSRNG